MRRKRQVVTVVVVVVVACSSVDYQEGKGELFRGVAESRGKRPPEGTDKGQEKQQRPVVLLEIFLRV
ncbi:hypothetical protein O3P69_020575 [Scylla paramamosain]|uniref:Secreted protein n=1 Tax=Scylla paramamosain TaxID=85552 RepID=A0AAW0TLQ9_SCYPA